MRLRMADDVLATARDQRRHPRADGRVLRRGDRPFEKSRSTRSRGPAERTGAVGRDCRCVTDDLGGRLGRDYCARHAGRPPAWPGPALLVLTRCRGVRLPTSGTHGPQQCDWTASPHRWGRHLSISEGTAPVPRSSPRNVAAAATNAVNQRPGLPCALTTGS
jgi:hypothetical protein